MALKRVTMQDIADACGLSRNTVSKVFNGRGSVPEATRKTVFAKAQELGYSQWLGGANGGEESGGSIAILTQRKVIGHGFMGSFLTSFTDQICRAGYTVKLYEVSAEEAAAKKLPPHLSLGEAAGILGIELFDREYLHMICALNKPALFIDGHARASLESIDCDHVCMEIQRMIEVGARRVGFVGDVEHCCSFHERWIGYRMALGAAGLTTDPAMCILDKDSALYSDTDWLLAKLAAMPELPDGFACANDFLAIHLMAALKKRGLSIPGDIMVTGFDGSVEAAVVDPPLTTAQIPSADIGRLAAAILTERIRTPDIPFRWTYVKTTPLYGGSTR